jgi:hypothetical protein
MGTKSKGVCDTNASLEDIECDEQASNLSSVSSTPLAITKTDVFSCSSPRSSCSQWTNDEALPVWLENVESHADNNFPVLSAVSTAATPNARYKSRPELVEMALNESTAGTIETARDSFWRTIGLGCLIPC